MMVRKTLYNLDSKGWDVPAMKNNTQPSHVQRIRAYDKCKPKEAMVPWYPGGKCIRRQGSTVSSLAHPVQNVFPPVAKSSVARGSERKQCGEAVGTSRKSASRIPKLPPFTKSFKDPSQVPSRFPYSTQPSTVLPAKTQSRVPVLKKPSRLAPIPSDHSNKNSATCEKNLSAAARRQQFHQSRHPAPLKALAAPEQSTHKVPAFPPLTKFSSRSSIIKTVSTEETSHITSYSNKTKFHDTLCSQRKETAKKNNICGEVTLPTVPAVLPLKESLLPVLQVVGTNLPNSGARIDNQQAKKKKNLLGEFTHFPAVCNILPSRPVKLPVSSVPSLPPILPPPPAPPPSISASLEQEIIDKTTISETIMEALTENEKTTTDAESSITVMQPPPINVEGDVPTTIDVECRRPQLVHTVSIVVEPVDIEISGPENGADAPNVEENDIVMKSEGGENMVKTIMDLAQLRKEEFARLLEEHAQIVREIKRAETGQI